MPRRAWLRAARPLAHANIAPPLVLGQALAYAQGHAIDPGLLALVHTFGAIDHLAIVFTNDVADREGDALNTAPTPFSGGSRVLQEGALTERQLRRAAWFMAFSLFAISLGGAFFFERPWLPLFALAALALLAAYSLPPLRLSYRGHGELCQGLGVGLVLPLLGFYAQAGSLADAPWPVFAPLVLMGFTSNILTALPDVPADRLARKATWPVRRGERTARRDALLLSGVALVLAASLSPPLPLAGIAAAFVPPALLIAGAARDLDRADAARRRDCLRFVLLAASSLTLAQVGWSLALFFAGC
jgi:1,4-dihydroxy-2-naphthoate octaprenyltransferase